MLGLSQAPRRWPGVPASPMQRPFLPLLETQWSQTWHFRQTTGCGDPVLEVLVNLPFLQWSTRASLLVPVGCGVPPRVRKKAAP